MLPTNTYTIALTANGSFRMLVAGRFFKIMSATGTVSVQSDFGKLADLTAGQGMEATDFQYLLLTDTSGATNTVKVLVADENFIDGLRGGIDITTAKVPISAAFANVAATVTNASASLIAANAARQYLLIQNKDLTGNIYINFGSAATVANGIKIAAGSSYEMNSTQSSGAVFAIGDIASNANIVTVQG